MGGVSSTSANFNLTGTLKFICLGAPSLTDVHLSNYAGTGISVARPFNLTIDAAPSSVITNIQIYPCRRPNSDNQWKSFNSKYEWIE